MLPIETETIVEATIERVDGRKVHLRSTLKDMPAKIAEGTGLFIVLARKRFSALARPIVERP